MDFEALKDQWTGLGADDPLWAVLSHDQARHGSWGIEDFFATGTAAVDEILAAVEARVPDFPRTHALDFGCGVGRLSQSLSEHFARVTGVDISVPMIEMARRLNRYGERCQYVVNHREDLSFIPDGSVDFVLTLIVLQHMPQSLALGYVREFVRTLSQGGLAVFQAPTRHDPPVDRFRLADGAYRARIEPALPTVTLTPGEMTFVPVRVANIGSSSWPKKPDDYRGDIRLRLGKRLYDSRGYGLPEDDERAALPDAVAPGKHIDVVLPLRAPQQPGVYRVELDLVHEHITWFADHGSQLAELTLEVVPAVAIDDQAASNPQSAEEPEPMSDAAPVPVPIQMFCLSEEIVRAEISASGGSVIASWRSPDSGDDWESLIYLVRREPASW